MTTATVEKVRWATDIARLWPPQGEWTEADFLALPESNQIIELSEGEIWIMPPPSYMHQRVVDNFHSLLKAFVQANDLGRTIFAPLAVRLWDGKIREPDVMFYSKAHLERLGGTISGVPDLVAEVISPRTRRIDREEKFGEYARAGVAEYWLIDPETHTAEVYTLDNGVYALHSHTQSALLDGFAVSVEALFV